MDIFNCLDKILILVVNLKVTCYNNKIKVKKKLSLIILSFDE